MPTVTKVGKRWRARANVGEGRQISAGNWPTKAEALQAALEVERRARAGNLAGAHGKRVRDILDRYAEDLAAADRNRWERTRLAFLATQPWAQKRADELTPADLGEWRDARLGLVRKGARAAPVRAVKGSTINRDFGLLSVVFNTARREWGWMNSNPLSDVRRAPEPGPRTRRLQPGEIEALRIASGYRPDSEPLTDTARVCAAAEFAIETAMRSAEICALLPAEVHARHVHLPKTKNGTARDVPLTARAREILDQVMALERVPVFGLSDSLRDALWRKVRARAMVKGLNFHDLRREATSRLAQRVDVLTLAKITGHKDVNLLASVYYAPTVDDLVRKLG